MEPSVVIVPAEEHHIPGIISCWKELMDFHEEIDAFYARSLDGHIHFEALIRDYLQSSEAHIMVALHDDRVVGYGTCHIHSFPPIFLRKRCGFIADLAVKSAYRRRGIGDKLLHSLYEWFQTQGVKRIQLRVSVHNRIGYSFWKKQGFEESIYVLTHTLE
jgi:ribosomal protein S18 acetylase RimI-like enzyme